MQSPGNNRAQGCQWRRALHRDEWLMLTLKGIEKERGERSILYTNDEMNNIEKHDRSGLLWMEGENGQR